MFFIAVLLVSLGVNAQQYQFVYVQTDNKQPFYIRVNDQLYSSSATGYVVVPKLQAGSYSLSIGFPKNEWPAQQIKVKVADKDMGFLLKNFDSKGWGLYNLQTMEVLSATTTQTVAASESSSTSNMFSEVLADVVNTPSIKTPVKEVKIADASEPLKKEQGNPVVVTESAAKPLQEPARAPISTVKKLSTLKDASGTVITYIADGPLSKDTVRIMLPAQESVLEAGEKVAEILTVIPVTQQPTTISEEKMVDAKPQKQSSSSKNTGDPKFLEIELPNPNNSSVPTTDKVIPQQSVPAKSAVTSKEKEDAALEMINSDCKKMADEEDFYKIRKNMSAERGDDDMVNAARKLFRQKCYSTEQVKNLAMLFLTDEGKYKFFDAAYPYIYDSGNFSRLQSELTDEYYINRFKAMIRK